MDLIRLFFMNVTKKRNKYLIYKFPLILEWKLVCVRSVPRRGYWFTVLGAPNYRNASGVTLRPDTRRLSIA